MSQRIPEETSKNNRSSSNDEPDLEQLPELPPGVYIPAPTTTPRLRTPWPDAIDVIFEKDPACQNIFEALLYQSLWAIIYHRIAHSLYKMHIPFLPRLISQFARFFTARLSIHPGPQIASLSFIRHV